MKITGFETFRVDGGWESFSFLKVTTDQGLVGWAEYSEARGRKGLTGLIRGLGQSLIGMDPRAINAIDALLYAWTRSTAGGLQSHASAALINACLDIKAKALRVPVHELLGGAVRDRVPVYWSHCGLFRARYSHLFGNVIDTPPVRTLDDLRAAGREVAARGFNALKTNVLIFDKAGVRLHGPGMGGGAGHPALNTDREVIEAIVTQLAALREGAGPAVRLALDLNFHYKPEGLRQIARKVEPFDLMWLEMDLYEPTALGLIRRSTTTPIGSLESVLGRRAFRAYLDERAVDVAIIDVQWNGMPEALRMASMADAHEVNVAAHNSSGPLSTVISGHFCSVVPNLRSMEVDMDEVPWRPKLLTNPYRVEVGEFILPSGPGWGTDIDEDVAREHAAQG
jgi:L-alanine-DL-glutamate epimerase-like enolase superfamily enzyme